MPAIVGSNDKRPVVAHPRERCALLAGAFVVAATLLAARSPAHALSCSEPTPESEAEHYESAHLVFTGRVVREDELSLDERWDHHGVVRTVTFEVLRLRKGQHRSPATLGFMEVPNSLPARFVAGEVYEVFAWRTEAGFVFTTTCGSSYPSRPEEAPAHAGCASCTIGGRQAAPTPLVLGALTVGIALRLRRRTSGDQA